MSTQAPVGLAGRLRFVSCPYRRMGAAPRVLRGPAPAATPASVVHRQPASGRCRIWLVGRCMRPTNPGPNGPDLIRLLRLGTSGPVRVYAVSVQFGMRRFQVGENVMKYVAPGQPGSIVDRRAAVRELHRRQVAGADARQVPRRPGARRPPDRSPRWRTRRRRTSSSRWTPRTRRRTPGARRRRPSGPRCSTRSPMRSRRTRRCSRSPRAGRTASRSARRSLPTSRWWSITSGTSPPRPAPRRGARPRSRRTWSPTTSGSRWVWSVRSSRSTSRC